MQQDRGTLNAEMLEALGGMSDLHLATPLGARIICEERGDDRTSKGDTIDIRFEPRRVMVFDAQSELLLGEGLWLRGGKGRL